MTDMYQPVERRTNVDVVFDSLYREIVSLDLLPGSKISEAEIAAKFGVSRQPVRDAFSRLGNLGFLLIRPQKATEIQKFSTNTINTARFLRVAIEAEVVATAARRWDGSQQAAFDANLAAQDRAVVENDLDAFHELDYKFHQLLCEAADVSFAFDAVMEQKAQLDRLCVLSIMDNTGIALLVEDHRKIYNHLSARQADEAVEMLRTHLARVGSTIEAVAQSHPEFFV